MQTSGCDLVKLCVWHTISRHHLSGLNNITWHEPAAAGFFKTGCGSTWDSWGFVSSGWLLSFLADLSFRGFCALAFALPFALAFGEALAFGDFFTEAFGFAFVVFGFGVSFGFLLLPRRAASSSILKHEGDLPQPHPKRASTTLQLRTREGCCRSKQLM